MSILSKLSLPLLLLAACSEEGGAASAPDDQLVYLRDVAKVTRVDDARNGVFIPPFVDCRGPLPGDTAARADGQVCTNVAISGCTEPGKYFPSYGSCEIVRTQRPYWPAKPAQEPPTNDPRLGEARYMAELGWVTEQIAASGCTCCHDNRVIAASQWDIARGPLWIDTLSDTGLALFAGLADSSVLGAYEAADNHGFDREITGIPSTDSARMQKFMVAELQRRGLGEAWARKVPPFGGPIYANSIRVPTACGDGEGVAPDGKVWWKGGTARYVYVLAQGSRNPGVPPNLDLPEGTLWRLDVLANRDPVSPGLVFGTTPEGSAQAFPESSKSAPLKAGATYQLVVLQDVGLPIASCLFTFGKAIAPVSDASPPPPVDAGSAYPDAGSSSVDASSSSDGAVSSCTQAGGDARGFGAACNDTANSTDCSCEANYCAKSPFDAQGYCSVKDCRNNPSICPVGFRCFDVSTFAPGQPSVCIKE